MLSATRLCGNHDRLPLGTTDFPSSLHRHECLERAPSIVRFTIVSAISIREKKKVRIRIVDATVEETNRRFLGTADRYAQHRNHPSS